MPLNVDSERCYPEDPGGVAETVALLADAGAAGFSIEDYDPATGRIDDVEQRIGAGRRRPPKRHTASAPRWCSRAGRKTTSAASTTSTTPSPGWSRTGTRGRTVYAPGLASIDQIEAVVKAVGVPVNVLALPDGPSVAELEAAGVRRVSTGGSGSARAAYGALMAGARELLADGTSRYSVSGVSNDVLAAAFAREH